MCVTERGRKGRKERGVGGTYRFCLFRRFFFVCFLFVGVFFLLFVVFFLFFFLNSVFCIVFSVVVFFFWGGGLLLLSFVCFVCFCLID